MAGVGWLSGTAAESLRAFGELVFANFRDKNIVFYNAGKQAICGWQKDLHTHDTVRRPLKEAFLPSKIVILDYFSRELPF